MDLIQNQDHLLCTPLPSENKIRDWSDSVFTPVAVRNSRNGNPAGAFLKNKKGLPGSPIKTN